VRAFPERRADEPFAPRERRFLFRHPPRVPRLLVIVPEQVEDPVREVTIELVPGGAPLGARAPDGRFERDYHVAQNRPNPGWIR
jgi:hypothetical protein